jgi:uncharacterized protein YyaL (SSP411 family)
MKSSYLLMAVMMLLGIVAGCRQEEAKEDVVTATEEKYVNKLIHETSPYLLQHAHNPVDWYPWGDEAFEKARKEQKPIFLSIGYSACHWCHVMERESFENEKIAEIMNREFICVKVDREEHPDVDEIYMSAVQMMTGSGGWPLSVFLTPDLKPFFGGTYFPPDDKFGRPGFEKILLSIALSWKERNEDVAKAAESMTEALLRKPTWVDGDIDSDVLAESAESLVYAFDQKWGGFGNAPKFPPTGSIALLMRQYRHSGSEKLLNMATLTLDKMAYGGMYDQLGGGFHRYSVDRTWLVPHFEKMLYDNALLSWVYLEAFQLTKKPIYKKVASETLDFVINEMTDESGGFHSAQDADSEGVEGKYYVWSRSEIMEILGADGGSFFCDYYGVTEGGNFEGENILFVPSETEDFARDEKKTAEKVEQKLDGLKKKLIAVRVKRVHPGQDYKVLTSWNGLMISSFAKGYQVLGDERYLVAAENAAKFISKDMIQDGALLHVYSKGKGKLPGYLDDYANVANAFIDLYETTFDIRWLDESERLTEKMIELFKDSDGPGFYFTADSHKHLLRRTKPFFDGSTPAGNSMATLVLLRLARLTDNSDYYDMAETVLKTVVPRAGRQPRGIGHLLRALDFYMSSPVEIAIAAKRDGKALSGML